MGTKPHQYHEATLTKKATGFFKAFLVGLARNRFKVLRFEWWAEENDEYVLVVRWFSID